jgi:hypothetical protein
VQNLCVLWLGIKLGIGFCIGLGIFHELSGLAKHIFRRTE